MLSADGLDGGPAINVWHNVQRPSDVNDDGYVSPLDALILLNELNGAGPRVLGSDEAVGVARVPAGKSSSPRYLDVNSDGMLTPLDALIVLNQLNVQHQVQIELEVSAIDGTPLTDPLGVGDAFRLSAYVEDLRDVPQGVFATYFDTSYDPSLALPQSAQPTFGPVYNELTSFDLSTPGLLAGVGSGTTAGTGPGAGRFLLFHVDFSAEGVGIVDFVPLPSSNPNFPDTTLWGENFAVPEEQIERLGTSVMIVPDLSIADISVPEGDGAGTAQFTVSLSAPAPFDITVDYTTADGSAVAGTDYLATSGTLLIEAGQQSGTISVDILGNTVPEPDRDFHVLLSSAVNAQIDVGTAVGTIVDDDPAPVASIGDISVLEGDDGLTDAVFTVTLSGPSGNPISIEFATSDGTGVAGVDYQETSGTVTFDPGETTATITVPVIANTTDQPDRTFFVDLFNPSNATLGVTQAEATILDDDDPPGMSINNVTVQEGDVGTTDAVFTVLLAAPSGKLVTVEYATMDDTAIAGDDYTAQNGVLTFQPGETQKTITIEVLSNGIVQPNRQFFVDLSNPINATLSINRGTGTIVDDDTNEPLVEITLEATHTNGSPISTLVVGDEFLVHAYVRDLREGAAAEGVFAAYLDVLFDSQLVMPLAPIQFDGIYSDGTTGSLATPGVVDEAGAFTLETPPLPSGELLLFTVRFVATGDGAVEFLADPADDLPTNEVLLFGSDLPVSQERIIYSGTSPIDVAPFPTISIDDVSVTEGNSGTVDAVFSVTLSAPAINPVTVEYSTQDGSATGGIDYFPISGTLIFQPGETTQTITVPVIGDTLDETNETFFVDMNTVVGASIDKGRGVGTIMDDDPPPSLSISDATVDEGDAGSTPLTFVVTLSTPSGRPVSVNYATADGTAVGGVDYVAAQGVLTFQPGQTTGTIQVDVIANTLNQFDRTLFLNLSSPQSVVLVDNQALGTIVDDDPPPALSIGDVSATEGNLGTTNAVFPVTLSGPSGKTITVNYTTLPGSATAGVDFLPRSGTLTFPPGATTRNIVVPVVGDTIDEPNETFFVQLSSPANASIARGQATGTIVDDDAPAGITIDDVTVVTGNALGTVEAVFTVRLTEQSGHTVTVNYATADGSALEGVHYTAAAGTVSFAPGETTRTITVPVNGTLEHGPTREFLIFLGGASNGNVVREQAVGTILNQAPLPSSLSGYIYVDGNNNGHKELSEWGIPDVAVMLIGTNDVGQQISRAAVSDASGAYQFNNLRPGVYFVSQVHPAFFRDGKDTIGSLGGNVSANDQFTITIHAGNTHSHNNNFGELGLRAEFMTRRLFLASTTPHALIDGSYHLDLSTGDLWFALNRGADGNLTIQATPAAGTRASLTLYDHNLTPLVFSSPPNGTAQINWTTATDDPLFVRLGGGSPSVQLRFASSGFGPSNTQVSARDVALANWAAHMLASSGQTGKQQESDELKPRDVQAVDMLFQLMR